MEEDTTLVGDQIVVISRNEDSRLVFEAYLKNFKVANKTTKLYIIEASMLGPFEYFTHAEELANADSNNQVIVVSMLSLKRFTEQVNEERLYNFLKKTNTFFVQIPSRRETILNAISMIEILNRN